jgi:integrase
MFRENDKSINGHHIYLYDDGVPILLPCLFARFIQVANQSVVRKTIKNEDTERKETRFEQKEICDDTAKTYGNHVGRFLEWVDNYKTIEQVSLNNHTALPSEVINEYINDYLIDECQSSESVARGAVNSLQAYYNFLFHHFKNKDKQIGIKSEYLPIARSNSKGALHVKYLLPKTCEIFYRKAPSLLHEIVLRNGGELGCRAKENQGFLLNDFTAHKEKHHGLLTLFKQLEANPEQEEFKYHLKSIYAKYGSSRTLYISKLLLKKMKQYYDKERPESDSNHLLVSNAKNRRGKPIGKGFASTVFLNIKKELMQDAQDNPLLYSNIQDIEKGWSYHILRHSFGTDFFYNLCEGQNKRYESITTTSAVYIETARRMGHKVDAKGAGDVTKRYIHSCGHRETLLKETVNEM